MKNNEDLIFRYRSGNELSFKELINGEFFFAGNKELNDPTEAKPLYVFKGNIDLWYKFIDYVLFKIKDYLPTVYKGSDFYHNLEQLFEKSHIIACKLNVEQKSGQINQFTISEYLSNEIDKLKVFSNNINQNTFLKIAEEVINNNVIALLYNYTKYFVSFSKSASNPTMWAHYANSYKGFCLVFSLKGKSITIKSTFKEFINIDTEGNFTRYLHNDTTNIKIDEVKYTTKLPRVNAFEILNSHFMYSEEEDHCDLPLNICAGIPKYDVKHFGFFKYKDWKYEQEIRCLIPTKAPRLIKNDNDFPRRDHELNCLPENRLYIYKPNHLRGVILGVHTDEQSVKRLIEAIRIMRARNVGYFSMNQKMLSPLFVLKAVYKPNKYPLLIVPYGVILENGDFLRGKLIDDKMINEIEVFSKLCNGNENEE